MNVRLSHIHMIYTYLVNKKKITKKKCIYINVQHSHIYMKYMYLVNIHVYMWVLYIYTEISGSLHIVQIYYTRIYTYMYICECCQFMLRPVHVIYTFLNCEVLFRFQKTVGGVYLHVTCVQHPQQQPHVNICTHIYIHVYMLLLQWFPRTEAYTYTGAAHIVQHPRSLIFVKMSICTCKYMPPLTDFCAAHMSICTCKYMAAYRRGSTYRQVCITLSARKQSSSHMWRYLHMIISCEHICALRVLHTSTSRYVHVNIYLCIYIHVRTNSPIDVAAHNMLSSFAVGRHTLQCVAINYEVLRLLLVWRPTAQGGRILCAATSIGLFLLGASHCSTCIDGASHCSTCIDTHG